MPGRGYLLVDDVSAAEKMSAAPTLCVKMM